MSTEFCQNCISGHLHSGTPKGQVEVIGGLNTYVSPSPNGSKKAVIIYITDIFGYELVVSCHHVMMIATMWLYTTTDNMIECKITC